MNVAVETELELPVGESLVQLRRKFNKECEHMYPAVVYPGDCYIFDVVLGIDPRLVVAGQAITKKNYKLYVLDGNGYFIRHWEVSGKREYTVVVRKFDPQQEKLIREWWELLSPEIRGL